MSVFNLVGFQKETQLIKKLIASEKIPHAFILVGKKSIGKSIFAKYMVAHISTHLSRDISPESTNYFEDTLKKCITSTYPDLHVLTEEEDKSKISVEQIRSLLQSTSLTSYYGKGTYILIEDAERLTVQAANALLKNLEEPSPNTFYILTTSQTQLIPETVLSRTFQINCGERTEQEILSILRQVTNDPQFTIDANILSVLDGCLDLLIQEDDFDRRTHLPLDCDKIKTHITKNAAELIDIQSRVQKILSISNLLDKKSQIIQFFRSSEKNEYAEACKTKIFFNTFASYLIQEEMPHIKDLEAFQKTLQAYTESQTRNLDIEMQLVAMV